MCQKWESYSEYLFINNIPFIRIIWVDDLTGNDAVRISRNLLLCISNENTSKNCQNQFYRTLEINRKLAIIWGAFIQEKWLTLNKNIKFCDILNGHVFSSLPQTPCRTWEPTTSKSGLPWPITLSVPSPKLCSQKFVII